MRSTVRGIDGVVERGKYTVEYCTVENERSTGKHNHHSEAGPGSPRKRATVVRAAPSVS